MSNKLNAISPLDGRYSNSLKPLSNYFSESALMQYRIKIEIEYLILLSKEKLIKELPTFTKKEESKLRSLYQKFDLIEAKKIKAFEKKTNHDVKAIEYYLQTKIKKSLHPWIHFALTSEDINNLSYSLMWKDAIENCYLPQLQLLNQTLKALARKYKKNAMISLTHGQPATPTTFGKELAVFYSRLNRQIIQIKSHKLLGKFGGATGTWSAHLLSYPRINWIRFSSKLIKSFKLEPNLITTQIESHDSMAESFNQITRVNIILNDFCKDIWLYISRGIVGQKKVLGEIGSSTMPHKINPIYFENAEGNIGMANSILIHLATKLPISRMQRDLSDSTVLRNQGVGLSHSYLSIKNIFKGLNRITIDKIRMKDELNSHWEILAEAIQTILRKSGEENAYEKLKNLTRGKIIDRVSISKFIEQLKISKEEKDMLLSLTPESYTGLSSNIVELI